MVLATEVIKIDLSLLTSDEVGLCFQHFPRERFLHMDLEMSNPCECLKYPCAADWMESTAGGLVDVYMIYMIWIKTLRCLTLLDLVKLQKLLFSIFTEYQGQFLFHKCSLTSADGYFKWRWRRSLRFTD